MADPQFEEFKAVFDKLPQHIKAPTYCYRLTLDDELSDEEGNVDECVLYATEIGDFSELESYSEKPDVNNSPIKRRRVPSSLTNDTSSSVSQGGTKEGDESERRQPNASSTSTGRKRRRLPETPVANSSPNGKGSSSIVFKTKAMSLADEIREAERHSETSHFNIKEDFQDHDSSPEEKIFNTDADSGNSTTHSPEGNGTYKAILNGFSSPTSSTCSSGVSLETLESLEATHRGLHKFMPRHRDEVEIEIGDLLYVQREADDLWCEGVNLRTGKCGVFPSAYATDVDYAEFDPGVIQPKKENFLLNYLSSIEVSISKGNHVLCQAIKKITATEISVHPVVLEVTDQGLRMVDRSKPLPNQVPCHDYFFCLKNISFCGFHPDDSRYFGFITKHPTEQRFACHVFLGDSTTRSVAEAVGRAFQRFEQKFAEAFERLEDIYLE